MLGLKPWENHVLRLANTLASNENVSFGSTEKKCMLKERLPSTHMQ